MWTWASTHECAGDTATTTSHTAASARDSGDRFDGVVIVECAVGVTVVYGITSIGMGIAAGRPPFRHLKRLAVGRIPRDIPCTCANGVSIRSRASNNREATLALVAAMANPGRRTLIADAFGDGFHAGFVFCAAIAFVGVADGALAGGFPSLAGLVVEEAGVGVGLAFEFAEDGVFVLEEVAD